jgi:hypothetical protein
MATRKLKNPQKVLRLAAKKLFQRRGINYTIQDTMPRQSPLPEQLRYLLPFRKEVAKLEPGESIENMDLSGLNRLLLRRIDKVPLAEGKKRLQQDQMALERWLATPGLEDNGAMHFVRGYLMALPGLVEALLEESAAPVERVEVEMDLPDTIKRRSTGGGGWQVSWLRTKVFVVPTEGGLPLTAHPLAKVTTTDVAFGNVIGRRAYIDMSIVESINVQYDLQVPGGRLCVVLIKKGTNLDPSPFEKYFHTLRLRRESKPFAG